MKKGKRKVALMVAEKPVVEILVGEDHVKCRSLSKFNPVYEFTYDVLGEPMKVRMTSVLGHIMNNDFGQGVKGKKWDKVDIKDLFSAKLS